MPTQKIDPKVIFASNAPAIDKPPVFGDKTKGWDVSRANDGRPTIKEMNKVQQDTDLKILWLNENSVTPYDSSIDYPEGSVVIKDGSFKQLASGAWVEFLDDFANKDEVKRGIANRYDSSLTYNSGERVVLTNRDIVKSTIDVNTNDPNVDMMGWVKTNSASQIFDESGLSQQEINSNFVTPEMYGAKANDPAFDNTTALNTAFATGKDVYSSADKTYHVTDNIVSKGQKLIGHWKISSTREGAITATADSSKNSTEKMRVMYVDATYDLVDLLVIKSLGINTILHYGQFYNRTIDTLKSLLNNATTAGLDVIIGTAPWVAKPDLNTWIGLAETYSCVVGYYAYDEPIGNNISIATQKALVDSIRALSKKPIAMTDGQINIGSVLLYNDYDIIFIDAYASSTGSGGVSALEVALRAARNSTGYYKGFYKNKKVIPCTQAYIHKYTDGSTIPIGNVLEYSDVFGRCENGDVGFFVWDGFVASDIVDRVKTNTLLQNMVRDLCQSVQKSKYFTQSYLFGSLNTNSIVRNDYGNTLIQDTLINPAGVTVALTSNMTVGVINGNSTIPQSSTSDRDFYSLDTYKWGGFLFKGASATASTNIKVNNLSYLAMVAGFNESRVATITFKETQDNGYSFNTLTTENYAGAYIQVGEHAKGSGGNLVIDIQTTVNPDETKFRDVIYGLIVNTNW